MSNGPGYHNCKAVLATKIRDLLRDLGPSTHDEIAPIIEYWIEYGLTEQFTTIVDLVELVSPVAWDTQGSPSDISRFLKEFRDAPHRSEQARSFVNELCLYVLRWFAVASADNFGAGWHNGLVSKGGGPGFISTASFVGHLIECGLLGRELVRCHLPKPLTTHRYNNNGDAMNQVIRANAIYNLFTVAGNTLLQGLLEPEDVLACFKKMAARIPLGEISGLDTIDAGRFTELCEFYTTRLQQRDEEGQRNATAAEVSATEVETPVAFVPQDPPAAHVDVDTSPSVLQDTELVESSPNTFVDARALTVSSPASSISTVSDLTPTESGDVMGEGSGGRMNTHHDTFYFEDGNVEIVCENTVFRIHSSIISFASSNLRDIVSPPTLLNAPMPEGRPRVTVSDSAEDFGALLKMIYTPGFPARNKVPEFTTFASLLRMATKYGFSDVRGQLVDSIKGAYPIKWEDFETTQVLGEAVFGSPSPHPNAVLNLFLELDVKIASPFAAYRAALGGLPSLASDEPSAILPRPTLASIIHGMGEIERVKTFAAHIIAYVGYVEVCPKGACVLNVGIRSTGQGLEALNKVYRVMADWNESDPFCPPELRTVVCADCAERLEASHLSWRKENFWAKLPRLLGWNDFEGV